MSETQPPGHMKIIRIAGRNLASYRDFDLPLDSGALADMPVFAIVGRTGAGKSTLLDALLLALYGELPRVAQAKSLDLGMGYDAGKAVAIVRRGENTAEAACEFIATDGLRYRSVWRVRKQRDGALKVADPTLQRVGEEGSIVRNKTEHAQAIERLVGLNALEFRRAVLIAQNDFAAFLKAEPAERARQLERITRQEQYAAIGARVHERMGAHFAALAEARAVLGAWAELSPEREAELVAARAEAESQQGAAAAEVERLAGHRRYLGQRDELLLAVTAAAEAEAQAQAGLAARSADAARLADADTAEPHRPIWENAERAGRLSREGEAEATRRAEAARVETEASLAAETTRDRAKSAAAAVRASLDPAAVALARAADEKVVARSAEASTVQEAERRARGAKDLAAAAVEPAEEQLRGAERSLAELERQLAELAGVEAVRADEGALAALDAAIAARVAAAESRTRATAAGAAADALRNREGNVALRHKAALAAEVEAEAAALGAGEPPDTAALGQAVSAASRRAERAELVRTRAGEVERARALAREREEELGKLEVSLRLHAEREPLLRAAVAEADAAVAGAERIVNATQAALSLEEHRTKLVEGEDCPLCGSREHPWGAAGAPRLAAGAEAELRALRANAAEKRREQDAAEGEAKAWRAAEPAARARRDEAVLAVAGAEAAILEAESARAADGPLPTAAESTAAVSAAEAARTAGESAAQRVAELRALAARAAQARAVLDRELAPLNAELGAAQALAAEAKRRVTEAQAAEAGADEEAERRFAAWPSGLDLRAPTARTQVLTSFKAVEAARKALEPQRLMVGDARAALKAVGATLAATSRELAEAEARAATAAASLAAATEARAPLLGGQATAAAVAAWEKAVAEAETEASAAAEAAKAAEARAAAAQAEGTRAQANAGTLREAGKRAASMVELALAGLGWSREAFAGALMPALDRSDLAAQLGKLQTALTVASAARNEAERAAGRLLVPAGLDEAALPGAEEAAQRALNDAQTALMKRSGELEQARHDHALRRSQGGEVERLEGVLRPWQRLAELIGGHDGKKFRELAQARTMQTLAELANDQLQRFAARYELRYLPEHPLELLVVDHDAGGEVRATSSLSGGETFLVSLALALALGRLSTRSLHLRTLFVDEGFGSLDADSVDPVIDALRSLADRGVQVGLISHVRGIAERLPARVEVVKSGANSTLRVVRG